jgi:hypothetical protein
MSKRNAFIVSSRLLYELMENAELENYTFVVHNKQLGFKEDSKRLEVEATNDFEFEPMYEQWQRLFDVLQILEEQPLTIKVSESGVLTLEIAI